MLSSRSVIRTQVSLTDEQMAGLRRLATQRQVSIAAVVREAVDDALARSDRRTRRARARRAIADRGADPGPPDLAESHDRYLDDLAGD